MSLRIYIREMNILGWYDGPVIAIGKSEQGKLLSLLVACVLPDQIDRIFLVIPLSDADEAEFLGPFDDKEKSPESASEESTKWLNGFLKLPKTDVFLSRDALNRDKSIELFRWSAYSPEKIVPYDIDNAWNADASVFWFSAFENAKQADA
jgi:hypothetical protein